MLKTVYYNLVKLAKGQRNWDGDINSNFDIIDTEIKDKDDRIKAQDTRINNIVAGAGTGNTEIVDSRLSPFKDKTYPVLKERLNTLEGEVMLLLSLCKPKRSGYHEDTQLYTVTEYKDLSGKLRYKSELIAYDANLKRFGQRKSTLYALDGVTVDKTLTNTLVYAANGDLVEEV